VIVVSCGLGLKSRVLCFACGMNLKGALCRHGHDRGVTAAVLLELRAPTGEVLLQRGEEDMGCPQSTADERLGEARPYHLLRLPGSG
jgi:hypothetical protein